MGLTLFLPSSFLSFSYHISCRADTCNIAVHTSCRANRRWLSLTRRMVSSLFSSCLISRAVDILLSILISRIVPVLCLCEWQRTAILHCVFSHTLYARLSLECICLAPHDSSTLLILKIDFYLCNLQSPTACIFFFLKEISHRDVSF